MQKAQGTACGKSYVGERRVTVMTPLWLEIYSNTVHMGQREVNEGKRSLTRSKLQRLQLQGESNMSESCMIRGASI